VKYIALEEAFSIPGIADPMPQLSSRATPFARCSLEQKQHVAHVVSEFARRDFLCSGLV
jgi:hypothetical protein